MPLEQVHHCRVAPCQAIKAQSNHWFVATAFKTDFPDSPRRQLLIEDFTPDTAALPGAQEICSEACLHTFLSRWASQQAITGTHKPDKES